METLLEGPAWMLREHSGILEVLGDTYGTYGGSGYQGFCGARGMVGVVVQAPMGLNRAAGHDGSDRQKEKMALRLGTVPEALIPGADWLKAVMGRDLNSPFNPSSRL